MKGKQCISGLSHEINKPACRNNKSKQNFLHDDSFILYCWARFLTQTKDNSEEVIISEDVYNIDLIFNSIIVIRDYTF